MKAPDKIYIAESLIKTPYGNEWSPSPYISRENTEYLRKDALLEWAKEEMKLLDESLGLAAWVTEETLDESFAAAVGERVVLQNVIDKLESL